MTDHGLIHIYCGDGKGKTSAAAGLAVRCSGAGKRVLFVQFLKDGTSCEITNLQRLESVKVLYLSSFSGFYHQKNESTQQKIKQDFIRLFEESIGLSEDFDLLVLDEIIATCGLGIIAYEKLLDFLDHKPKHLEIVLTGRNPSPELIRRADYVTEMKKIKHPYDNGIPARKGIEY